MSQALLWAAGGTGFTFFMTTLGAAVVFFFRKKVNIGIQRIFLGFAAGVMIAASIWSLLIPAIDQAEKAGGIGWIPAAGGFVLGILFLVGLDSLLPHLHPGAKDPEGVQMCIRDRYKAVQRTYHADFHTGQLVERCLHLRPVLSDDVRIIAPRLRQVVARKIHLVAKEVPAVRAEGAERVGGK